jgi:hypothetical protein
MYYKKGNKKMIKKIVKVIGVDSLEVAEAISGHIADCIANELEDYFYRQYETLNTGDIYNIMEDNEWWNDLLENLMHQLKV